VSKIEKELGWLSQRKRKREPTKLDSINKTAACRKGRRDFEVTVGHRGKRCMSEVVATAVLHVPGHKFHETFQTQDG
jgi:hypothetical protein